MDADTCLCEHITSSVSALHARTEEHSFRQLNGPSLACLSGRDSPQLQLPQIMDTISNMKLANPIKGIVSKRRKRYTADGFNLDLTCILYYISIFTFISITFNSYFVLLLGNYDYLNKIITTFFIFYLKQIYYVDHIFLSVKSKITTFMLLIQSYLHIYKYYLMKHFKSNFLN